MVNNPLQFAVVREDPDVLASIIKKRSPKKILLTASGGCLALSLKAKFPEISFTLYDVNEFQINHVKKKVQCLKSSDRNALFNIETINPHGLNDCGNFEGLFRGLRQFIYEFILDYNGFTDLFCNPETKVDVRTVLFSNRYWEVAFEMFFNDRLLNTMFGPEATQNAQPGSYIYYFKNLFEKGLTKPGFQTNYFLHHIFLGHYLKKSLPTYLKTDVPDLNFKFIHSSVDCLEKFNQYELIDFSNIFDWCSEKSVKPIINRCNEEMAVGSIVVFRQLNNFLNLQSFFGSYFDFSESSALELNTRDLFYNKYNIGVKRR